MSIKEKSNVNNFPSLCAQTCFQMSAQNIIQDILHIGLFQGNSIQNKKTVKISSLQNQGHVKNILNHKPSIAQTLNTYGLVYTVYTACCCCFTRSIWSSKHNAMKC